MAKPRPGEYGFKPFSFTAGKLYAEAEQEEKKRSELERQRRILDYEQQKAEFAEWKEEKPLRRKEKQLGVEQKGLKVEAYKKDKPIREMERARAKIGLELADEAKEAQKAKLKRETVQAIQGLEQDKIDYHANRMATATPQNWSSVAKSLNKEGNYNFTGNWKKDKEKREELVNQMVQTIEHRQAMEDRRVQLEIAEAYANKTPQIALEAAAAYPDDPAMQTQLIQERLEAETQQILSQSERRKRGTSAQFNVQRPTADEERTAANRFALHVEENNKLDNISTNDQKDFIQRALYRAKVLQKGAALQGAPLSFPDAYDQAVVELSQYLVENPEDTWGPDPDYKFMPPTGLGSAAGAYGRPPYDPTKPITVSNHPFSSAMEVKQASKRDEISRAVAIAILEENFAEELAGFVKQQQGRKEKSKEKSVEPIAEDIYLP